eukprot:3396126-Amphidinium_carterae.2
MELPLLPLARDVSVARSSSCVTLVIAREGKMHFVRSQPRHKARARVRARSRGALAPSIAVKTTHAGAVGSQPRSSPKARLGVISIVKSKK